MQATKAVKIAETPNGWAWSLMTSLKTLEQVFFGMPL
jgi:hypothetical protein